MGDIMRTLVLGLAYLVAIPMLIVAWILLDMVVVMADIVDDLIQGPICPKK